jgi:hypothetical protein
MGDESGTQYISNEPILVEARGRALVAASMRRAGADWMERRDSADAAGKSDAEGYIERIFMYRRKSGKSSRAATRLPKAKIATTTIPKIAIVCIIDSSCQR